MGDNTFFGLVGGAGMNVGCGSIGVDKAVSGIVTDLSGIDRTALEDVPGYWSKDGSTSRGLLARYAMVGLDSD